jgi:integrase
MMPKPGKLKGVIEITSPSGRVYRYLRIKGQPLVKLPGRSPTDPHFLAAYAAAMLAAPEGAKPQTRHATGSLGAACEVALASDRYHASGKATRAMFKRHLSVMAEMRGKAPMHQIQQQHIRADVQSANAKGHRLRTWRFLFSVLLELGLVDSNPAALVKMPKGPPAKSHPPWDADDIAAYRARWPIGTPARAAMELLHWTGARISDAVMIGPQMVDAGGVLRYRQTKTKDMAYVPWSCPLPAYAHGLEADRRMMLAAIAPLAGQMTFLATGRGVTRSSKSLGNDVRGWARAAGVAKSAHGFRSCRAIALAEAGASIHQISAWTGHQSLKEIQHYTEQTDRRAAVMGDAKKA